MTFDRSQIPGWGADLDRKNRPAVPMERTPPRLEGVHWDEPSQQPQHMEVLHSIERPHITPVFGATVPPSGLSGVLRRRAFTYSENDLRHWMTLLMADRVNVVEGVVDDMRRNPASHPLVLAGVAGALGWWMYKKKRG
ncbi:hypothetical protein [Cognatilysobacter bugurensis]|uniref:Uncharacterized protein n=1 Tax=Cognatilysobacter bugurensis TaxID=543356 RepID=A0A918W3F0_9GAMM|nr:hypothetical protein [Lysobacter bugurensis]GHA68547.1 hypothetical protein GCM10007067_00490 [Lysobacter bugurensis]